MLRLPNPFSKRRLSRRERALAASQLAAPTQDVGHVRAQNRRATINGLLASIPPEKAQSISSRLQEARGLS